MKFKAIVMAALTVSSTANAEPAQGTYNRTSDWAYLPASLVPSCGAEVRRGLEKNATSKIQRVTLAKDWLAIGTASFVVVLRNSNGVVGSRLVPKRAGERGQVVLNVGVVTTTAGQGIMFGRTYIDENMNVVCDDSYAAHASK